MFGSSHLRYNDLECSGQNFYYIVELIHDSDGSLVACGRPAGGKGGRE